MRRANALQIAALAASLSAACGGEDTGRPSPDIVVAPPLDECARAEKYEFLPVVDFEGIGNYAQCSPGVKCRNTPRPGDDTMSLDISPFYFNLDLAHTDQGGDLVAGCPSPRKLLDTNMDLLSNRRDVEGVRLPDGPRCGVSKGGLHFWANGVGFCFGEDGRLGWGAAIDLEFKRPPDEGKPDDDVPFDASDYDGVSFWVRRGSPQSASALILSVIDVQNEGSQDPVEGPTTIPHCGCMQMGPKMWSCSRDPDQDFSSFGKFPDAQKCDAYGAAVSLTDEWSFVPVSFSGLRQKGFGVASGPFDSSKITRLQFLMTFGDWDLWIDDIAFYKVR